MTLNLDSILNLSTPKKLAILGLFLVLVCGLVLWKAILPGYEDLEEKYAEYNKLKVEYDEKKQVAQDPATFEAKLKKVQHELELMKSQLPDKKEIPNLLKTISSLGKESGLQFQMFRPIAEVSKDFYAEIPVEIRVEGGYHEVADFFYKVGMLDRIVNIGKVDMGKATEENEKIKLTTSCLATTFRFIEAPPPETATAKQGKEDAKTKKRRKK
ncbi:MAG: type 4a pilus biogenesis protein PilO [Deltaproteobacteria bacterium]|nr:type 4a pilus biogenesis protein PilO [Deltaproteobacteria bacterium]